MEREYRVGCGTLRLLKGDITQQQVEAVVNAANERLVLGGGVAGAIRQAGGPAIQADCNGKGPIRTGEAVATTGGELPARFVIHTVGPRGGVPGADQLLESAVGAALRVAEEKRLRSVAFPAISTGIFGYPLDSCARIMTRVCASWLDNPDHRLEEIRIVLFDEPAFRAFEEVLDGLPGQTRTSPRRPKRP